ncbi:MAG: carboxypeptidase regulatory-like domain-containing protein [Deltaproteobacteria bacterium]|nr:carboxypeptidase regulatory-like domain-containing protein [Deltaproteobacteria bacterium]
MLAALLLVVGCAGDYNMYDSGNMESLDGGLPEGTLRVDVYPSDDGSGALPQSFLLAPGAYGEGITLSHDLDATVSLSGSLSADSYQGWSASASSASGALSAVVRAERSGLVQSGAAATDEAGAFALPLPGQQPYDLAIVPSDATVAPMLLFPSTDVGAGVDLSQHLGPGAPVYGRVTDAEGNRIASAPLRMRHADSEVYSATFYADDSGWFVARAEPGYDYVIETVASEASRGVFVPAVATEFVVEDAAGAQVDIDVGLLGTFRYDARIVDGNGEVVGGATIRATSRGLEGSAGSYTVETTNLDTGYVYLDLLAGTYQIEVWPAYADQRLAPFSEVVSVNRDVDAGDVALAGSATITGAVETAEGTRVAGATVTATQRAGGKYTFSTTANDRGDYSLDLPAATYDIVINAPAPEAGALATRYVDGRDGGELRHDVTLASGTPVVGVVRLGDAALGLSLVEVVDPNSGSLLARTLTDLDGNYSVRVALPERDDDGGSDTAGGEDSGADTGG